MFMISDHYKKQSLNDIAIIGSDEMEIGLFQILKASNAPLVYFDRVISWLRKYESNIE